MTSRIDIIREKLIISINDTVDNLKCLGASDIADGIIDSLKLNIKCTWSNSEGATADDTDTHWETSCGKDFMLNDGTPDDNGFDYCCYCGKTIDQLVEE